MLEELLWIAHNGIVVSTEKTQYGMKFSIRGDIRAHGRNEYIEIFTVWQIDNGSDYPVLVTAYPREKGKVLERL